MTTGIEARVVGRGGLGGTPIRRAADLERLMVCPDAALKVRSAEVREVRAAGERSAK